MTTSISALEEELDELIELDDEDEFSLEDEEETPSDEDEEDDTPPDEEDEEETPSEDDEEEETPPDEDDDSPSDDELLLEGMCRLLKSTDSRKKSNAPARIEESKGLDCKRFARSRAHRLDDSKSPCQPRDQNQAVNPKRSKRRTTGNGNRRLYQIPDAFEKKRKNSIAFDSFLR